MYNNTAPTTAVAQKSACAWDISARSFWSHSPFIPSSSSLPLEASSENTWTRAKIRQDSGFVSFKCSNPNQNMKKAHDRSQALVLQPPQPLHSQATIRIIPFWRTLNHIAIPRLWMVYGDLVYKELHYAPFTKASSRNRFPPPKTMLSLIYPSATICALQSHRVPTEFHPKKKRFPWICKDKIHVVKL